ncbi:MAG: SAM-dependent methyltransferase [Cyclobacteriaceae bacterium]
MKGKIILIPTYLSPSNTRDFLSKDIHDQIANIRCFLVENVRTARRFISSLKLGLVIEDLQFEVLDKRTEPEHLNRLILPLSTGQNIGIISEAGMPGIADPGQLMVSFAHTRNIDVFCLPGASSITMALASSGFNGQQFTFHGYLPIDNSERDRKIKQLEMELKKTSYTQLFMETPYRNDKFLAALLNALSPNTMLFIGADLSGADCFSKTKSIKDWKLNVPKLGKTPCVFGIGTTS